VSSTPGTSVEILCYFLPSVAEPALRCHDPSILLICPRTFLDRWIQLSKVSLAALQSCAPTIHMLGHQSPLAEPILLHELQQLVILHNNNNNNNNNNNIININVS